MSHIAIVGAGVAGLSVAFELLQRRTGHAVHLYEASNLPGGNIRTDYVDGFTIEWGPNGFLDSVPETLDLVERLGISDRLLPASMASKRRFIWRNGRLREVKPNPVAFLASGLLSWSGKLRIMAEPFTDTPPDGDQTVFEFATRHIGEEAASVLVDAMVSGVFAGNARELSLKSAFPRMHEMESRYTSLVRALLARMRERRPEGENAKPHSRLQQAYAPAAGPAGHLTSFRGGMSDLISALVRAVGPERIRFRAKVETVGRDRCGAFRLHLAQAQVAEADALILAVPAWNAAPLVRDLAPDMAAALEDIPGAPLCVVATAFKRTDVKHPLDGFGFLVPRGQGLTILGSLWTSSIFPGRAPEGWVLLRTMVGGAHLPTLASLSDTELLRIVRGDLRTSLGITARPALWRIYRHPRGIPQYTVGHEDRLGRIHAACDAIPGLYVIGNSYEGIAVNACVKAAAPLAKRVARDVPVRHR